MRFHRRNKQIHFVTFFDRHRELTSSKEEIIVYQFRKTSWIFFFGRGPKKKKMLKEGKIRKPRQNQNRKTKLRE